MNLETKFVRRPSLLMCATALGGVVTVMMQLAVLLAPGMHRPRPTEPLFPQRSAIEPTSLLSLEEGDEQDEDDELEVVEEAPPLPPLLTPAQNAQMARMHEVVRNAMPNLLRCFDVNGPSKPRDPKGPLVLRILVDGQGKIDDVSPRRVGQVAPKVIACAVQLASTLVFPPADSKAQVELLIVLNDRPSPSRERGRLVTL